MRRAKKEQRKKEEKQPRESTLKPGEAKRPLFIAGWGGVLGETLSPPKPEAPPRKNKKALDTPRGMVEIENYSPSSMLEKLSIDDGIFMFSRHNPERQKEALVNVAKSDGGNVVTAVIGETLVGYVGIHHPSERERWGKPKYNWLFELGAIEVSRNYRKLGIANAMLQATFDDPFYEDKIVFATGFTWHWDMEGTGLDKFQYRSMGVKFFGRYGFMEMSTDESNISMDPANLFLVRLGKSTTFSQYQKFAALLFANEWEAMLRGI
ncbi:MAG: GNAT family N-acetyltransferase [Actinomycetota bacterium]|nr:GNAT family N-acetyltransferase [Actinomycetota bacterium]